MVEVKADMRPVKPAWPPGHQFGRPCKCKASPEKHLRYIQPERAVSFKPQKVFRPPESKMPDGTTYKMSYEAFDPKSVRSCRGVPTIAKENLISAGDFHDDTTHKMSYGAWPGIKKQSIIYPRDHKLSGDGPMQELTTHKHDYTPKPIDTSPVIVNPPSIGLSSAPMERNSVMSMSYKCPDYNSFEPATSYKPLTRYLPPESPVDDSTTQKLSYMPWKPQQKPDMPWARRYSYVLPNVPLETHTVYNGSYMAPGKMIEDSGGHLEGCYCLFPTECFDADGNPPNKTTCPPNYDPNTENTRVNPGEIPSVSAQMNA